MRPPMYDRSMTALLVASDGARNATTGSATAIAAPIAANRPRRGIRSRSPDRGP